MGKRGGTYILLFVFISFFGFVSFVFPRQTGFAEEVSFEEMLQTVRWAGEEVRVLQFQTQRVLGPLLPPDETPIVSTLRLGMRGKEVRALQELLRRDREIYPEGLVTGYFGVLTDNAVKRFQAAQGLEITGIVDSWTRAYLRGFSRVAPPLLTSEQEAVIVPEVQDVALSLEPEVVSVSTSTISTSTLSVSTSTAISIPTSTVSSGGSGGGGSPTVQPSGSSGGSGGSSPAPSASAPSDTSEMVVVATSTAATSTPSLAAVSPTSTDSVSSTTVSVVSSTVVLDDADNDNDDDYDMNDDDDNNTDKKAEKKLEKEEKRGIKETKKEEKTVEKEMKKAEKAVEKVEKKEDRGGAVVEEIKLEIQEVSVSSGAFSNLATVLSSLSGLLGRMSSFFR